MELGKHGRKERAALEEKQMVRYVSVCYPVLWWVC